MTLSSLVSFISAEWILTKFQQSNGGAVILARSIFVASWITFLLFLAYGIQSGSFCNIFNLSFIKSHLFDGVKIFGTILAFVYAALYARFSAQWRYLADLYNKIKETQARNGANPTILAEWKAGFIEDADELHLATKKIFMSVIHHWIDEDDVKVEFIKNTPCGRSHYENLKSRVDGAYLKHEMALSDRFK